MKPAFDNTFCWRKGGRGSHDVDIIAGRGFVMVILDYKGRGGQKSREK